MSLVLWVASAAVLAAAVGAALWKGQRLLAAGYATVGLGYLVIFFNNTPGGGLMGGLALLVGCLLICASFFMTHKPVEKPE